jgi:outer membrane lipoprotein-sorting protein
MKTLLVAAAIIFLPACTHAQAKACEELKTEIAAKLDQKGVKGYSLEIVAKDQDAAGKVVGTCEGGAKKIVYQKGAPAEETRKNDSKP